MLKALFYCSAFFLVSFSTVAQNQGKLVLKVMNDSLQSLPFTTVELLKQDSLLVKIQLTDSSGTTSFHDVQPGEYVFRISQVGFEKMVSTKFSVEAGKETILPPIQLSRLNTTLAAVTVSATKRFIEFHPDKTVINLEAAITNVGATALEALEKLPGISIDKDGNIMLKGRTGVSIMIDGKLTYLGSAELNTMLSGMSASAISQVEIMDNPSARYDAAGNAGMINIKTKKRDVRGFNGSISTSYAQGMYPKTNNNLQLNYRSGKFNTFLNFSSNINRTFTRLEALRTYFKEDGTTVLSKLDQPGFFTGKIYTHTVRTGLDYFLNDRTTIGLTLNGLLLGRKSTGSNKAHWLNAQGATDSIVNTESSNKTAWQNAGVNLSLRHEFNKTTEFTADLDMIGYRIRGDQFFENTMLFPGSYVEASKADIPSDLRIISAKTDYSRQFNKVKMDAGWKSSRITTDNLAAYAFRSNNNWIDDLGKTNHFLYKENIHAFYTSAEAQLKKFTVQGGLRYELTNYDARQLGNLQVKDSSFSRSYNSLFPTLFLNYTLDSLHRFSFSSGRRIDRPAFQKLNPFLFIINKYTYQRGNPFFRPQYTWNFEFTHLYKELLVTSLSYGNTRDYFSQIFPVDTSGIVLYTEGNLGRLKVFSASVALQLSPATWWSLSAQGVLNHKILKGTIYKQFNTSITQFQWNLSNNFRFRKGWSAELSAFYASRSQQDIQEIVDPSGSLSAGISKTVLKNKGTVKLAVRDIFYTQWMKGFTELQLANEVFSLTRDTRVVSVSFTWRFGKSLKAIRRSEGAAGEEIQRVGNG